MPMVLREPIPIPTDTPTLTPTPTDTLTPTRTPTPNPDPHEPNDNFGQAWCCLTPGEPLYGHFLAGGDREDFYQFQMESSHALELWLWDIPASSHYHLYLYDPQRRYVAHSADFDRSQHIGPTGVLGPGTYYVRVYRADGGPVPQPYGLCVEFVGTGRRCPRPATARSVTWSLWNRGWVISSSNPWRSRPPVVELSMSAPSKTECRNEE